LQYPNLCTANDVTAALLVPQSITC